MTMTVAVSAFFVAKRFRLFETFEIPVLSVTSWIANLLKSIELRADSKSRLLVIRLLVLIVFIRQNPFLGAANTFRRSIRLQPHRH